MRFRQYIPVKTDSGGGGENPDPGVYCPANGYVLDPEVFHPPFPLPEATEHSIIFICNAETSNWNGSTWRQKIGMSGGNLRLYELFDTNANLLDSWTSVSEFMDFDFPSNDRYYVVKISIPTGLLTLCYNNDAIIAPFNSCIEAAIFNTPALSAVNFRSNLNFYAADFRCSLDVLNSFYQFAQDCISLTFFNFFVFYPNLSRIDSMFARSNIKKVDLRHCDMPSLRYMDNMVNGCKYLDEFHFMPVCYAERSYDMFAKTIRLRQLTMYISSPNMGNINPGSSITRTFQESAFENDIIYPEPNIATSAASLLYKCSNFKKVKFLGNWSLITSFINALADCPSLEEIEMPPIMRSDAILSAVLNNNTISVKKFIGPDIGHVVIPTGGNSLEEITGEQDTSGFATHPTISLNNTYRNTFHTFNCPKLRIARFVMGTTLANKFLLVNEIILDWANSSLNFASITSPTIQISAAINATEINRIFTLIPNAPATGRIIDVRFSDGYATCDKTIAENKGWTVL